MDFHKFAKTVNDHFQTKMANLPLYVVASDREMIYKTYLEAFPEGTNPIFKERTEHDCNTCKSFIRDLGNVVAIKDDGSYITIWDVVNDDYQIIADAMAKYIRSLAITDIFLHWQNAVGNEKNVVLEGNGTRTFNHFFTKLPNVLVDKAGRDSRKGEVRSTVGVFERGLQTISEATIDTVLELINQGSVYRGNEFKKTVEDFKKHLKAYLSIGENPTLKKAYVWKNYRAPSAGIRNMAIGTFILDIESGKDLEQAVDAFGRVMDPRNYKRTSAVITKSMIDAAVTEIREMGAESALQRRHAELTDISVNNVIWATGNAQMTMKDSLTDMLMADAAVSTPKSFDKVEEISIGDFIANVVPTATKIEVLFENKHKGNLMSLIAPQDASAPNILKWDNNFSWSYNGDTTDSIKERVKAAGGATEGYLRVSLSWYNTDDLDLNIREPNGNIIYYGNKGTRQRSSGMLDVDMNVSSPVRGAVENIVYSNGNQMPNGTYTVKVHNFTRRESKDTGFQIQTEYNGVIQTFDFAKSPANKDETLVLEFTKDANGITFKTTGKTETKREQIYGIFTNDFIPVQCMSYSPNHWDANVIGNKHYFFFLENCKTEEAIRGLYNEFLSNDFLKHRKVFEVLGSRMMVQPNTQQLSGLGFSETVNNELVVRVQGVTQRMLKIKF